VDQSAFLAPVDQSTADFADRADGQGTASIRAIDVIRGEWLRQRRVAA